MMILRNKIKIIVFTFGIVFLMTFSKTFSCTYVQTTHKTDNCCEYDKKIKTDGIVDPNHLADNYIYLHNQPRDAWTFELDLRPWRETW